MGSKILCWSLIPYKIYVIFGNKIKKLCQKISQWEYLVFFETINYASILNGLTLYLL